ncbi:hypothetical protein B0T10DRAFT_493079 [Thelonectria olida]|uniref:Uncharacterized protein n=1 Tax=Thelonectria olida TaxID=1576542 RepID=A0A9P8VYA6_9HYPO|nr:hypothetical protein B0T10DRAFT_493079 [Thelonectria olida]
MLFASLLVACISSIALATEISPGERINITLQVGTLTGTGVVEFFSLQCPTTNVYGDITTPIPKTIVATTPEDSAMETSTYTITEEDTTTLTTTITRTHEVGNFTSSSPTGIGTIHNQNGYPSFPTSPTFKFTATPVPTFPVTSSAVTLSQQVWPMSFVLALFGIGVLFF